MTTDASSSSNQSYEFPVQKVKRSKKRQPTQPLQESIRCNVGGDLQSTSATTDEHVLTRIGSYHAVLAAVYTAYSLHYPLVLNADALWITIGQGIACHRVIHGGTPEVKTLRLNTTTNSSIESWCTAIRDHVGPELADLLACNFSTTTPIDKTVGHVVLMDVFRRYYNQQRISICGIPSVTLEGTVEDYELLRQKTRTALAKLDMDWWLKDLEPLLDQFVKARQGNVDKEHWQNICKHQEAYGGAIINGWIAKFFPYLRSFCRGPCRIRNPAIGAKDGDHEGFSTLNAPSGLSKVPFEEDGVRKELVAGFVGVTQDAKTLALRPLTGWVVRKADKEDALIHRLIREQQQQQSASIVSLKETPMEQRKLFGSDDVRSEHWEADHPEDLYRLHYQLQAIRVGPIRLLPQPDNVRGWSKIADLEDGRFVVADLEDRVRDPRIPAEDLSDPSCCVIGVCCRPREDSQEEKEGNHQLQGIVVAYSVVEWLEQSLDWASQKQQPSCYWDAPDYVPLGDLQNPTSYYDEMNEKEAKERGEKEESDSTKKKKKKKKPGILTVLKKVLKQGYS